MTQPQFNKGSLPQRELRQIFGLTEGAGVSDELIKTITKALAAATPGPWEVVDIDPIHIAKGYRYEGGNHIANWIAEIDSDDENGNQYTDAHLIANAPEWLRFLLKERERLKIALYTHESYDKTVCELHDELVAKDKVLEWYAEELRDRGHEARTILSRYKGEDTPEKP